jgi:ribosomal protein S18 acetylase RimI-like enzyme
VKIRADGWLSERFGHPVFTVDELDSGVDGDELRRHAADQAVATYQAKAPTENVRLADELSDHGFRVVCTAVTLSRAADAPPIEPGPDEPPVRPADPERDSELPELTASAFWATRFHLDPDVPDELARLIKHDWIAALIAGERGDETLVADVDGRPAGFLGVVSRADVRTIDLVAVAAGAQSRGAGRALVRRFCEDSRGRCETVEVGTQAANERGIQFYERLGFAVARTAYDLHMHVGSPWTA